MSETPLNVEAIRKLAEAATGLPWQQGGCSGRMFLEDGATEAGAGRDVADFDTKANSDFALAACNSILPACDEVERLRAEVEKERELRVQARAQRDHLIKECARVGVTVKVSIGAPLETAYVLVNDAADAADNRIAELTAECNGLASDLRNAERMIP